MVSNQLSTTDAKVVRRTDDSLLLSDGPFSESKEWVGGFFIVDVDGVERAVEIAGRLEETTFSVVEIRALMHCGRPPSALSRPGMAAGTGEWGAQRI